MRVEKPLSEIAPHLKAQKKLETVFGIAHKECKKIGGKTNVAHNVVDRHASSWRHNKVAYILVREPVGDVHKITYFELYRDVNRFVNALKA